jgi:hypothetical protein
MMREYHVRICEGLGVKLPGSTRRNLKEDRGDVGIIRSPVRAWILPNRMNRPRPCWAPAGVRPKVACQLVREFIYLYEAISPKDGAGAFLILPSSDAECFQIFLDALARSFPGGISC